MHPCIDNSRFEHAQTPDYVPDDNDQSELNVKTVRIKFNIMQFSETDPRNFEEGNADHEDFLDEIMRILNGNLTNPINCPLWNNGTDCLCDINNCGVIGGVNDCCVSNSKLQFYREDIIYYQDPLAWDCSGGGGAPCCDPADACVYLPNNYLTDEDCILNIFMFESPGLQDNDIKGCGPGWCGEATNYVYIRNVFDYYENSTAPSNEIKQKTATLFFHEISHCLGLGHTDWNNEVSDIDFINGEVDFLCNPGVVTDCSNNVMAAADRWFKNWLSPLQIGTMHRLLIGSFRSKQLKMDYDPAKTIFITQDETWDLGKVVYGDVIITPGNRLTITCKTIMPPGGKIIVRPNAELFVDGGLITIASNECDPYWDGIHVHGDALQNQFFSFGQRRQGFVVLKNGATIEYATTGVRTYNSNGSSSGGIVSAKNTLFSNNDRAVDFGTYQNTLNGSSYENLSHFHECEFIKTEDYRGSTFSEHVLLQGVDGIGFEGCDFANDDYADINFNRGRGIRAVDSHFEVLPFCLAPTTPSCSLVRSSFAGFARGIEVSTTGFELNTYLVDRADFTDNYIGIYSRAIDNPIITRSDFNIANYPFINGGRSGIYIHSGTGYTIQENTFDGLLSNNFPVGVVIRNTGGAVNEVRRNTYDDLFVGNLSNEINRHPLAGFFGLGYLCNENTNNTFDFAVPEESWITTPYGISINQGSNAQSAGNIFSLNGNNLESDFQNQSNSEVNYYYYDPLSNPPTGEQPITFSALVIPDDALQPNPCNVHYPEYTDSGPGDESSTKGLYWQNLQLSDSLNLVLFNTIDGGNSETLSDDIENSTATDAIQLKSDLLNLSPWLSTDILKEASDRTDVLSHSNMYDILEANPDEIQKEDLLDYLANKADPMPFNMIESLKNISFQSSPRTDLESAIGMANSQRHFAASVLAHTYQSDTLIQDIDSVRLWLSRQESLSADMAIVDSWLHEGNTSAATQHLSNITQIHTLSMQQQVDYNHFRFLKNIQIGLINNNRGASELTTSESQQVSNIADNGTDKARIQAQNIINAYYGGNYYDEAILPTIQGGFREAGQTSNPPALITAFPNPTAGLVHFHYQLDKVYNDMSIRIFSINGELVKEINLEEKTKGYASWDTGELESGFYFYSISSNEHALATGKLVISK